MASSVNTFTELLRLVANGDPVAAGTLNRIFQVLDTNTKYIKDLFNAAELSSAIFARGVSVSSDVSVGMPVYFNSKTNTYEKAIAKVEVDSGSGALKTSPSTQVWGVVHSKSNPTKADLL